MSNVLLIEDNKEIHKMVEVSLSNSIGHLNWAEDISTAKKFLSLSSYDIILLDVNLPDGNGIELCQELFAADPTVTIFILTSEDSLSDKVLGFSAGAEDYITKPFSTLELRARVEAKLKRKELLKQNRNQLNWKEVKVNITNQEVQILHNGSYKKIELTALEFKLLTYLGSKEGQVIKRDTILNDIWGVNVHVYSRSVDTHISKLRKKLEDVAHIIESVHGAGYKFNPTCA
jgi:two-component system phosphate regulon response regulator PhoB